jgi:uncharacterized membrane protein YoaK (UPF0700 family)
MITLYDRRESADQIEFEFHFIPVINLLVFLLILASLVPGGRCTNRLRPACGILLILFFIGLMPAGLELEEAMRAGRVSVSGSKFSFTQPLRVVITRKP